MATALEHEQICPLQAEADVVTARRLVRQWMAAMAFNLVDQTKMVTAASEIARNTVVYGGGGTMRIEQLTAGTRRGLRLTFEDEGPGVGDIELALKDGYTTGGGLGLGLGGAKRLVNEFDIQSTPGKGTRIMMTRWK